MGVTPSTQGRQGPVSRLRSLARGLYLRTLTASIVTPLIDIAAELKNLRILAEQGAFQGGLSPSQTPRAFRTGDPTPDSLDLAYQEVRPADLEASMLDYVEAQDRLIQATGGIPDDEAVLAEVERSRRDDGRSSYAH